MWPYLPPVMRFYKAQTLVNLKSKSILAFKICPQMMFSMTLGLLRWCSNARAHSCIRDAEVELASYYNKNSGMVVMFTLQKSQNAKSDT